MKKNLTLSYTEYRDLSELTQDDIDLILKAENNLVNAYAPYSHFKVSAVVVFQDGTVFFGTNQENAAFPSGLCAERVALFSAKSNFPNKNVDSIFIVTEHQNEYPFSPCGACRQVLIEYELEQKQPIRVVLKSGNSKIWMFNSVKEILPFAFNGQERLKKN